MNESLRSYANVGRRQRPIKGLSICLLASAVLALTACSDSDSSLAGADTNVSSSSNPESSSSSTEEFASLTDSRDGQVYKTVTIGSQTWMAENLNYEYNEGSAKSFCYGNDPKNCEKLGRLYLWSAVMDSAAVFSKDGKDCGHGKTCGNGDFVRGVCPEGWHLPNNEEWNTLLVAIGGSGSACAKLKSASGWNGGVDENVSLGFSALPAGRYTSSNDSFTAMDDGAFFWSRTEFDEERGNEMSLSCNSEIAQLMHAGKSMAISVRCLKD